MALMACLAFLTELSAQFSLSAEVRPRTEFRHGFKRPLATQLNPALFTEQRTRLTSTFVSDKFDLKVSFQDVRIWGAASQIYKSDPALQNIYEGWAAYKFDDRHALALGRMELDYDNARILGNLDWAQQGRSHDLVKYTYSGSNASFHVGAAFNQDANTPEFAKLEGTLLMGVNSYKTMQFAWYNKKWDKGTLSLLFLNNGMQAADSSVNFTQTMGLYGTKSIGNKGLEYEFYYQTGKDIAGRNVSGILAAANFTLWRTNPNNLNVGFDYVSGNRSDTDRNEAFDPLYGTHHKFYGFMDYFYVGSPHMNKGLIDGFVKAKFKTGDNSVLMAHVHEFFTASEIGLSETGNKLSATLGTEIDLVYNQKVAPGIVLHVGYSQMFYTDSMEFLKGTPDARSNASWAWAMISFKPTLFTSKAE